ncbi:MAG: 2-succinyl-5-enolpyruvyl-6-hydroxy-3-cyclohexene-1-carboxylic-acid synthase [Leptolyngbyaceae cyanobacterium]
MLDFRNTNTLWASVLVATLAHLGVKTVVISPGSRSTPLVMAFARHQQIQAVPILDERSASFLALGAAKASGTPTVLVCTSGTAGANYFPAVIEAYESEIPLIVLTADRPPELRDCTSGQTIDQQKLFGRFVRSYRDLSLPEATQSQLRYLRQAIAHSCRLSLAPVAGPVHINCPFRDPLAPSTTESTPTASLVNTISKDLFNHLAPTSVSPVASGNVLPKLFGQTARGLIIVGPHPLPSVEKAQSWCQAIATLSSRLGWPVLTDGLSPLRNYAALNSQLITTYDFLLRHGHHAQALLPEQVLQVGALPTSKVLRQWLAEADPQRWILSQSDRNLDPLHGQSTTLALSVEQLTAAMAEHQPAAGEYGQAWKTRQALAQTRLKQQFDSLNTLFEGKVSYQLSRLLPPQTPIMIANSMPVRDVEWFWSLNDAHILPFCSRGANGIDGTLSTALGITHEHGAAVLLTGDLALLHDSNGLLNAQQRASHLTILLINNQGGGIFESLPIAQFEPPFERFFAMPQQIDFSRLAAAHHLEYILITDWNSLAEHLKALPLTGVRILEIRCDRASDTQFRINLLADIGDFWL